MGGLRPPASAALLPAEMGWQRQEQRESSAPHCQKVEKWMHGKGLSLATGALGGAQISPAQLPLE